MANTCKTCRHENAEQINIMLADGQPLRKIMDRFKGLSTGGLQRHKEGCLRELFDEVREQKRIGLLADVDEVKREIQLAKMEFADNGQIRVQLIGKRLDAIEKEAKLTGAYQQDRKNDADIDRVVEAYRLWEEWYGNPDEEKQKRWVGMLADKSGISAGEIMRKIRFEAIDATENVQ